MQRQHEKIQLNIVQAIFFLFCCLWGLFVLISTFVDFHILEKKVFDDNRALVCFLLILLVQNAFKNDFANGVRKCFYVLEGILFLLGLINASIPFVVYGLSVLICYFFIQNNKNSNQKLISTIGCIMTILLLLLFVGMTLSNVLGTVMQNLPGWIARFGIHFHGKNIISVLMYRRTLDKIIAMIVVLVVCIIMFLLFKKSFERRTIRAVLFVGTAAAIVFCDYRICAVLLICQFVLLIIKLRSLQYVVTMKKIDSYVILFGVGVLLLVSSFFLENGVNNFIQKKYEQRSVEIGEILQNNGAKGFDVLEDLTLVSTETDPWLVLDKEQLDLADVYNVNVDIKYCSNVGEQILLYGIGDYEAGKLNLEAGSNYARLGFVKDTDTGVRVDLTSQNQQLIRVNKIIFNDFSYLGVKIAFVTRKISEVLLLICVLYALIKRFSFVEVEGENDSKKNS